VGAFLEVFRPVFAAGRLLVVERLTDFLADFPVDCPVDFLDRLAFEAPVARFVAFFAMRTSPREG
jgi:hypothetical protein